MVEMAKERKLKTGAKIINQWRYEKLLAKISVISMALLLRKHGGGERKWRTAGGGGESGG